MVALSYILGQKFYPIPYDLKSIGLYIALGLSIYAIFALTNQCFDFSPILKLLVGTAFLLVYLFVVYRRDGRSIYASFIGK
jgi:hypothetical protein